MRGERVGSGQTQVSMAGGVQGSAICAGAALGGPEEARARSRSLVFWALVPERFFWRSTSGRGCRGEAECGA